MPWNARNSLKPIRPGPHITSRIIQPDILSNIIPFCDHQTLHQLSLVSPTIDHQIIPYLFRHVSIDFQRGRIVIPSSSIPQRSSSVSAQTENDKNPITARFANALRCARILVIRGHDQGTCQARYYTQGLPTQMIDALRNVHTVRLHTIRRFPGPIKAEPQDSSIAGFCGEGDEEVCHLVHLLRERFVIYSRPPNGFTWKSHMFSASEDIARPDYHHSTPFTSSLNIPGKRQILIIGEYQTTNSTLRHVLSPCVFDAPITVVVQSSSGHHHPQLSPTAAESIIDHAARLCMLNACGNLRVLCETGTADIFKEAKLRRKERMDQLFARVPELSQGGQAKIFRKTDEMIQVVVLDEEQGSCGSMHSRVRRWRTGIKW